MLTDAELARKEIVVIGASAGGIEALRALLPSLPATFGIPVVTVMHLGRGQPSLLTEVFGRACALPVREPLDKQPIEAGLWFAPPDYHLLTEKNHTFALSVDEPVLHSRPAVDVLFESAASAYGAHTLAIVLTGASADGAQGVTRIMKAGGDALAEDPSDAAMPMMPRAAIGAGATPTSLAELRRTLIRMSELAR